MKARMVLTAALAALIPLQLQAARLMHGYTQGEKYRILSEVNEEVLINGALSHRSIILNKVAIDIAEVKDGAGRLECDFQMSETIQGMTGPYFLKEDYRSLLWRDARGTCTIGPEYYMPVIRNVPWFPAAEVRPGDTWTGDAEEVHDLRRGYGIQKPFRFPVKVHYTYLRDEDKQGVKAAVIKVQYNTFHTVTMDGYPARPVPVKITGTSEQLCYWDIAAGKLISSHEDFDYIFFLSNASSVEYRGSADSRLMRSAALDRDRTADELGSRIRDDKISDASVRKDRNGVTIILENVRFPPNSYELAESEKEKLSRVARILEKYPDRDLRITGHTARVGDERTSQLLSEQRAAAVGDFFLSRGACKKSQLITAGKGSREPVAGNENEAGRRKNRRVEITILEN